MVASVTHAFVNPKADSADTTITRPSDWNADHVVAGVALTGRQCIPIMAGAMIPNTTGGAATGSVELAGILVMLVSLDFDPGTNESAQWAIPMPKSWDEGTITFRPVWSHGATTVNFGVVWELSAVAAGDGEAPVSFGTGQTSMDSGGSTNTIYVGLESAPITIGNSPAQDDVVFFRVRRLTSDGSDTLAVDARLHAIKLFLTTVEGNDA